MMQSYDSNSCEAPFWVAKPMRAFPRGKTQKELQCLQILPRVGWDIDIDKLDKAGLVDDPYVTQGGIQSVAWQDWPWVEYPNILYIQMPSISTLVRVFVPIKVLDGYNFCINGWVSLFYQSRVLQTQNPLQPLLNTRKGSQLLRLSHGLLPNGRHCNMWALYILVW